MKYTDVDNSRPPATAVWVKEEYLFEPDRFKCSNCGEWTLQPSQECPVCGARMTGIRKDPVWIDEIVFIEENGVWRDPQDGR